MGISRCFPRDIPAPHPRHRQVPSRRSGCSGEPFPSIRRAVQMFFLRRGFFCLFLSRVPGLSQEAAAEWVNPGRRAGLDPGLQAGNGQFGLGMAVLFCHRTSGKRRREPRSIFPPCTHPNSLPQPYPACKPQLGTKCWEKALKNADLWDAEWIFPQGSCFCICSSLACVFSLLTGGAARAGGPWVGDNGPADEPALSFLAEISGKREGSRTVAHFPSAAASFHNLCFGKRQGFSLLRGFILIFLL